MDLMLKVGDEVQINQGEWAGHRGYVVHVGKRLVAVDHLNEDDSALALYEQPVPLGAMSIIGWNPDIEELVEFRIGDDHFRFKK